MKIIKNIDDKRLQSSFYEKLIFLTIFQPFHWKQIVQFLDLYRRYYPFNQKNPWNKQRPLTITLAERKITMFTFISIPCCNGRCMYRWSIILCIKLWIKKLIFVLEWTGTTNIVLIVLLYPVAKERAKSYKFANSMHIVIEHAKTGN